MDTHQDLSDEQSVTMAYETIAEADDLDVVNITPEYTTVARQYPAKPTVTVDDSTVEPDMVRNNDGAELPTRLGHTYEHINIRSNERIHFGDVHNFIHYKPEHQASRLGEIGIAFDMGVSTGNKRQISAFESARANRTNYTLKKRPAVSLWNTWARSYALD